MKAGEGCYPIPDGETMSRAGRDQGERVLARKPGRDASVMVARGIQELVNSRGLRPGERIGREEDLAAAFGVGRPTLREALKILSSAHLVRAVKGRGGGILVAATPEQALALNVSELISSMARAGSITIDELLETRILLEVPLAGLAALRATPEGVDELQRLLAELERAASDQREFARLDAAIHRSVCRMADNRVALALSAWIADVLLPMIHPLVFPALLESVVVEHQRELVEAIARADQSSAESAMRAQIIYTADLLAAVGAQGNVPAL
jgi:GntR family transcriptional repressor for pyruvate dehydrogenase complex